MFGFGRKKKSVRQGSGSRRSNIPPLLARQGRFMLVVAAVTCAFGAVAFRLYWLHVVDAPYLREDAESKRRSFIQNSAERGRILDSRGGVFATSREVWDVVVDPGSFTPEQEANLGKIAAEVGRIIGRPEREVREIFERRFRDDPPAGTAAAAPVEAPGPEVGEDGITPESRREIRWAKLMDGVDLTVRDAIVKLRVRAVRCERRFEREYPRGSLAAHLIGYVNRVGQPSMGIEKAFDFYLRGESGWIDSVRDKKGREMADRRLRAIPPSDGQNVELTLDASLQQIVETELERIGTEYNPVAATIIVSEAKTGRLLALGNWPTFNLNEYNDPNKAPMDHQRNRAVTDIYEPGSVFKVVSYAAALQEGMITPDTMIDCGVSSALYRSKEIALPDDSHRVGRVTIRRSLWESSNRAAAMIGMRVAEAKGEHRFWKYVSDFGFGATTGLVTGTEVPGILHKPERWDGKTISRMPIGHAIGVTPLQMHYAMGVIASGGDLYAPMLVERVLGARVIGPDGEERREIVRQFEPVVKQRGVISKQAAATLADMLRGVCSREGTARHAAIPGYDVAGKTGTTQKLIDGRYSRSHHVASFSGFFPAGDPRLVITVVVDEPRGKGTAYGGVYSAPAFRNVAEQAIRWLDIPPSNRLEFEEARDKALKRGGATPKPATTPVPPILPFVTT